MTDDSKGEGLYIDSDWKEEAAREKERLAEQEKKENAGASARGDAGPEVTFLELINTLAMQAAIAMGGLQGADGQQIPPNPVAAKHVIDLIDILEKKTKGNLTDDEARVLGSVLYELRMNYVQMVGGPAPVPGANASEES